MRPESRLDVVTVQPLPDVRSEEMVWRRARAPEERIAWPRPPIPIGRSWTNAASIRLLGVPNGCRSLAKRRRSPATASGVRRDRGCRPLLYCATSLSTLCVAGTGLDRRKSTQISFRNLEVFFDQSDIASNAKQLPHHVAQLEV